MRYRCPRCGWTVPMEPHEWPLHCVCGHRSEDGTDSAKANEPHERVVRRQASYSAKVGTELTAILAELSITGEIIDEDGDGCDSCRNLAQKMDQWGIPGCIKRKCKIVEKLGESAKKLGWWTKIKATACGVFSPLVFAIDLADIPGSIFDEALRRAELKIPDEVFLVERGWCLVPDPPPLDLKPQSERAIVTVAAGLMGRELLEITGPYMREYAARLNADFVVLDWPGAPEWPLSSKFGIGRTLDFYERVCFVDVDILFRPGCVDLFSLCEPHEFGFVDELDFHKLTPKFRCIAKYQKFRKTMGFRELDAPPWMLNSGVMIIPRSHQHVLNPPTKPIPIDHCAEQNHFGAALLDSGLPYRVLPRKANWQIWTDVRFVTALPDAILHWSGMHNGRFASIKEWTARYPLPKPEWEMDARHTAWIGRTAMSGRFRRVLEVGTFQGFSTRPLLEAVKAGAVDELHLCDPVVTGQLRELVASFDLGSKVTLHERRSVDLLTEDAAFSLVVIDGDHSIENVTEEARLLLAAGVRSIFAHDTAIAGWGPERLKAEFIQAGYFAFEDAENRPDERTARGLLWAAKEQADFEAGATALFSD